jgi:hypothetical protein
MTVTVSTVRQLPNPELIYFSVVLPERESDNRWSHVRELSEEDVVYMHAIWQSPILLDGTSN